MLIKSPELNEVELLYNEQPLKTNNNNLAFSGTSAICIHPHLSFLKQKTIKKIQKLLCIQI